MSDTPPNDKTKQQIRHLREVIVALDRRQPRIERVGETAIARDAAAKKRRRSNDSPSSKPMSNSRRRRARIRGGEERDLPAVVAMGQVRASPFRFHLDRDVDFVQYAITKKRLLAGLGPARERQLHFFIAEEGITVAAYVVVSVVGST